MSNAKITTSEAIMLIITIMIAHTFVSLPNDILNQANSAALLNLIYVGILATLFVFVIYKLLKNFPGCDILDISEYTFGKAGKNILGIIFIGYLVFSSGILLRNFCECLRTIYYPMTDILFVMLFFAIGVIFAGGLKFNGSLKANLIITPIVFASIVFLFLGNLKNFSGYKVFPILGNGFTNTFILGLQNIFAFGGVFFIYFLPPLLKEPQKFKKIAFTAIIISGILLLVCVSILLFMFPLFLDTDEILPLFSAARHIEFGTFFQRLESIFLLIWKFAFCCYLSITNKFMILIFSKITMLKKPKQITFPFVLIVISIALIPGNYAVSKFLESTVYKYVVITIIFLISFIVLLSGNIKKKLKKGGEEKLVES